MSTNNDPREFSLRKQLKLNHVVDILAVDDDQAANQENLVELQRTWLNLGHALTAAEHLHDFVDDLEDDLCEIMGDNPYCIGASFAIACFPNPLRIACDIFSMVAGTISYAILVGVTIAYQAVSDIYEIATMSDKEAYYGQYYSRATYINTFEYNKKNWEALNVINSNMKDQHKEMKGQLQERHRDIANHVGQDIADTQNALGQAIVDAQNDLGQAIVEAQNDIGRGIVDSQNDIGQGIVDAQNALGQDIVGESYFGLKCIDKLHEMKLVIQLYLYSLYVNHRRFKLYH